MKNPYISVIMSIYNEPIDWLRNSIDSILNQSFSDFEFIIVNDNPKNVFNKQLLESYITEDNRILVICNKKNLGLTKSLNNALKIAKGKYIARMDADDISLIGRFDKQVGFLDKNKDFVGCGSQAVMINESGKKIKLIKVPEKHESILKDLIVNNPVLHPALMFRNYVILNNNLYYNEQLLYAQDYDFVIRLLNHGKIKNLNKKLLLYRVSKQQIGNKHLEKQSVSANETRSKLINRELKRLDNGLLNLEENYFNSKNTELVKFIFDNRKILKNNILENTNVSLILNSNINFSFSEILKVILSTETRMKNKIRLLLKFFNKLF